MAAPGGGLTVDASRLAAGEAAAARVGWGMFSQDLRVSPGSTRIVPLGRAAVRRAARRRRIPSRLFFIYRHILRTARKAESGLGGSEEARPNRPGETGPSRKETDPPPKETSPPRKSFTHQPALEDRGSPTSRTRFPVRGAAGVDSDARVVTKGECGMGDGRPAAAAAAARADPPRKRRASGRPPHRRAGPAGPHPVRRIGRCQ